MALVDEDWSSVQRPVRYLTPFRSYGEVGVEDDEDDDSDELDTAIEWVFSQLTPEECFIARARYYEKVTIRELAARMGLEKSHMHRLCRRTEMHLRTVAVEHPVIQGRLGLAGG